MARRRISSVLVVTVVLISSLSALLVLPTGLVERAEGLTLTQTTQQDFETGNGWNVNTSNSPGNLTLVPSPTDWVMYENNPVLTEGQLGSWDDYNAWAPSVIKDGPIYKMWYTGVNSSLWPAWRIGYATSSDGLNWSKYPDPVLSPDPSSSWESGLVITPSVIKKDGVFMMWYSGALTATGTNEKIGFATSLDGVNWTRVVTEPVLKNGAPGEWDSNVVTDPFVMFDGGEYRMWYNGNTGPGCHAAIGYAESFDGVSWNKSASNPVLNPGPAGSWEDCATGGTHVEKITGVYYMWYEGMRSGSPYDLGVASSFDGVNWTKSPLNPILRHGEAGSWDAGGLSSPAVLLESGRIKMWVNGGGPAQHASIGYATAAYATRFTKEPGNPVVDLGPLGSWDSQFVEYPSVLEDGGAYKMWYAGSNGVLLGIGYAASADGLVWNKYEKNPVLTGGPLGSWDEQVGDQTVIKNGALYEMWYTGHSASGSGPTGIGYANSTDGMLWTKYPGNPVIVAGPGPWDSIAAYLPNVLKDASGYRMWYTGRGIGGLCRILYATSVDGKSWSKFPAPVLEYSGGTWDDPNVYSPTVVEMPGLLMMWYSGGSSINAKVGIATSTDNITWNKYAGNPVLNWGPSGSWDALAASGTSVLCESSSCRMWYLGSDGVNRRIGHAVSADGFSWTKKAVNPVMSPTPGKWDDYSVREPSVLRDGQTYKMWFASHNSATLWQMRIGYAESPDGMNWQEYPDQVLGPNVSNAWESHSVTVPHVIKVGGIYKMWYAGGLDDVVFRIGYAESLDGINWTRPSPNPVLDLGPPGSWDSVSLTIASVLLDNGTYRMWYGGTNNSGAILSIGYAVSSDGRNWSKYGQNPVITPGPPGSWDSVAIDPDYIEKIGSVFFMWYMGWDGSRMRIGLAISADGVDWTKSALNPILSEGPLPYVWDRAHVFHPGLVREQNTMKMWYSGDAGDGPWHVKIGLAEAQILGAGTFESSVFDSGGNGTIWNAIYWNATLPPNTIALFSSRSGDTPTPDASWSNWTEDLTISGSLLTLPRSRYAQYRITLASLDAVDTPSVDDVSIMYTMNAGTAPQLTSPLNGSWTKNRWPMFTWIFRDPNPLDFQTAFEVQIDHNSSFGSIDYQSGQIPSQNSYWNVNQQMNDGCWYWRVRTRDNWMTWGDWASPWKFCIDTTAPVTSLTLGWPQYSWAGTTYVNSSTMVALTATDGIGIGVNTTMFRTWDGHAWSPWAAYSSAFAFSGQDGLKSVEYYSFDYLVNTETVKNTTVFLDNTPPSTSVQVNGPHYIDGGNYYVIWATTFSLPSSDAGAGVSSTFYRVDLSPQDPYLAPFNLAGLEGLHTIIFRSVDNLGNKEEWGTFTVFVDTKPPDTSLTIGLPRYEFNPTYVTSSTPFNLTASEDVTHLDAIWWRIDSGAWIQYTSDFTVATEGPHTLHYYSTDILGNRETEASYPFVVDNLPPSTSLMFYGNVFPSGPLTYVSGATLVWLLPSDSGSGVNVTWFRIDSGGWTQLVAPITIPPGGPHVLEYRSSDNLGNAESTQSITLQVDNSPPVTTAAIGTPKYGTSPVYITRATAITLTANDADTLVSSTWYRIDSGPWTPYGGSITISTPGYHTLEYNSTDSLGNIEPVNVLSVFVDVNDPTTTITYQGNTHVSGGNFYIANTTVINLTATDPEVPVSATWYRIDGGAWTLYTSNFTIATAGSHTIAFNSTDVLGIAEASLLVTLYVDIVPPLTILTHQGPSFVSAGVLYVTNATVISFTALDLSSGPAFTLYSIDGLGAVPYLGPFTISAPGPHTLEYGSVDRVGNAENPIAINLFVDDSPPTTNLDIIGNKIGTNPTYVDSDTLFDLSATDGGAGLENSMYSIDGGSWMPFTAPFTMQSLADGLHHLSYRSVDNLGNTEEAQSLMVFLDTTPPTANAGEDTSIPQNTLFTFNGGLSSDNAAITNYTWTFTYRGETMRLYGVSPSFKFEDAGTFDVTLTVKDIMGNTGSDTVKLDVTAPPTEENKPSVDLPWLILIALLIVIVAALLVLYLRERRKGAPVVESEEEAEAEEEEEDESSEMDSEGEEEEIE
jgi:predicted GH43/DUF377 family glycosyl hydrolase